jgi:ATPase subunit of ABC transporter with duplicated ATPase domains
MADDKKIIFSMVGVSKTFPPHKQVLKDIYLSFYYGAKIGIIGLNGSGKSTLLKIIAGIEKEYQGDVVSDKSFTVGYLEQDPKLDPDKIVIDVVREGVKPVMDLLTEYEDINLKFGLPEYYEDEEKMNGLFARQAELQDKLDACDAWNIDNRLERAMDALRCPPEDQSISELSGGERRRVALCRLLLQEPDVLLLDEPTNHLDAESIDWLEQHLQQYRGTVICITHDRYFLDHVAGWILELDRGEGIPWKGNYTSWLEQKTKRMEQEEKQASKRRKTLERELEWINLAPKARHAKGKARINSYEQMLNQDQKEREEKLEIFIPNGPRLGNKVIEAHGVSKAFGDKLLFDNLNFMLPPNGIVGVIGPNGADVVIFDNLIRGEFHFLPLKEISIIKSWQGHTSFEFKEKMNLVDKDGLLTDVLNDIEPPYEPIRNTPAQIEWLADSLINNLLFASNLFQRGEYAHLHNIFQYIQKYTLWLIRIYEQSEKHWESPTKKLEVDISSYWYNKYQTIVPIITRKSLNKALLNAFVLSKDIFKKTNVSSSKLELIYRIENTFEINHRNEET